MECLSLAYNNNIINKTSDSSRCLCLHRPPPPSWQYRRVRHTSRETLSFPSVFLAIIGINQIWPMATFKWYKWPIRKARRRYTVIITRMSVVLRAAGVRLFCGAPEQIKRISGWQCIRMSRNTFRPVLFSLGHYAHTCTHTNKYLHRSTLYRSAQRKRGRERESEQNKKYKIL